MSHHVLRPLTRLRCRKLFANIYIVTVLNPKGIVFFIAFLQQCVNPHPEAAPRLWILAATFVTHATLYAMSAGSARLFLTSLASQCGFHLSRRFPAVCCWSLGFAGEATDLRMASSSTEKRSVRLHALSQISTRVLHAGITIAGVRVVHLFG